MDQILIIDQDTTRSQNIARDFLLGGEGQIFIHITKKYDSPTIVQAQLNEKAQLTLSPATEPVSAFRLILIHGNDPFPEAPWKIEPEMATLCVVYGGYRGIHPGKPNLPYHIYSSIDRGDSLGLEAARELHDFSTGQTPHWPSILTAPSYDRSLEGKLKLLHLLLSPELNHVIGEREERELGSVIYRLEPEIDRDFWESFRKKWISGSQNLSEITKQLALPPANSTEQQASPIQPFEKVGNRDRILIIWDSIPEEYKDGRRFREEDKRAFFQDLFLPYSSEELDLTKFHNYFFEIIESPADIFEEEGSDKISLEYPLDEIREVYILAELNWSGLGRTAFEGVSVVNTLRENRVKCPIFICSFCPRSFFKAQKEIRFRILGTPGHNFIQLPAGGTIYHDNEELRLHGMSPLLLDDILYYCMDRAGLLDETFHTLKNLMLKPGVDLPTVVSEELAALETSIDPFRIPEFHTLLDQLAAQLTTPAEDPIDTLYEYKKKFLELIPKDSEETGSAEESQVRNWQVLFVDDDKNNVLQMMSELKAHGIGCVPAQRGEDVMTILEADSKGELDSCDPAFEAFGEVKMLREGLQPVNSITLVISDWRFLTPNGDWEIWQGYDIIGHIFKNLPNQVSFFILTSKTGGIVRTAQRMKYMNISWFSKDDVLKTKTGFDLFTDQVTQMGNDTFDALCSRPKVSSWENEKQKGNLIPGTSLEAYYKMYRQSSKYHFKEADINLETLNFVNDAEKLRRGETLEHKVRPFQVKTKILRAAREDYPENWEKFYEKLLVRRIILSLSINRKWSMDEIAPLLEYQRLEVDEEERAKIRKNLKFFLGVHHGLGFNYDRYTGDAILTDFPEHVLMEERNFLRFELNAAEGEEYDPNVRFYEAAGLLIEKFVTKFNKPHGPEKQIQVTITHGPDIRNFLLQALDLHPDMATALYKESAWNQFLGELDNLFSQFTNSFRRHRLIRPLEYLFFFEMGRQLSTFLPKKKGWTPDKPREILREFQQGLTSASDPKSVESLSQKAEYTLSMPRFGI